MKAHRWELQEPLLASCHQPSATSRNGWLLLPKSGSPFRSRTAPRPPLRGGPQAGSRGREKSGTALGCGSLAFQPPDSPPTCSVASGKCLYLSEPEQSHL